MNWTADWPPKILAHQFSSGVFDLNFDFEYQKWSKARDAM